MARGNLAAESLVYGPETLLRWGFTTASYSMKSTNIKETAHSVALKAREQVQGHRGAVIWLTGLPASGKSTLAMEMEKRLFDRGLNCYVLDGDNIRHGLCSDLGFSAEDRSENMRRTGEVAALFADAGVICICALVSPFAADRARARGMAKDRFFEVHVQASSEACAQRDPKKLYEKHRKGEFKGLTGVDAPYEAPENPDLRLNTEAMGIAESAGILEKHILDWTSITKHLSGFIKGMLPVLAISNTESLGYLTSFI